MYDAARDDVLRLLADQPGPTTCQCEHASDVPGGDGHACLSVLAGDARAQHVGAICEACAQTHMAPYLTRTRPGQL